MEPRAVTKTNTTQNRNSKNEIGDDVQDRDRDLVVECVFQALVQICGGLGRNNHSSRDARLLQGDEDHDVTLPDGSQQQQKQQQQQEHHALLRQLAKDSVSFPNKNYKGVVNQKNVVDEDASLGGKPHDIEVRIALKLFNLWKNQQEQQQRQSIKQDSSATTPESQNHHRPNHETTDDSTDTTTTPAKRRRPPVDKWGGNSIITFISEFGLARTVTSPKELADLLLQPMEELLCTYCFPSTTEEGPIPTDQEEGSSSSSSFHVQAAPSGMIYILSQARTQQLQEAGRFPCPHCTTWCKGSKGLWWHQQKHHGMEHGQATATAAANTTTMELAIVPYQPQQHYRPSSCTTRLDPCSPHRSPNTTSTSTVSKPTSAASWLTECFEFAKHGDLVSLQQRVDQQKQQQQRQHPSNELGDNLVLMDPTTAMDDKGSTLLLWAAGGGHLDMVQYLINDCECDPTQGQQGKRSFRGRTALHWAARNGHYEMVHYLITVLEQRALAAATAVKKENESATDDHRSTFLEQATIDGTTAFGWASWQGHLEVMKLLHDRGCNIHTINTFGCNAVLWCAQGDGCSVPILEWLKSQQVTMDILNHNGHGVLHKAAQRGQWEVCQWFWENIVWPKVSMSTTGPGGSSSSSSSTTTAWQLVGPDQEGYCPSDLAGMEGHEELVQWLVQQEIKLVEYIVVVARQRLQQPMQPPMPTCETESTTTPHESIYDCRPHSTVPVTVLGSSVGLPQWLTSVSSVKDGDGNPTSMKLSSAKEHNLWERYGGVRRMRSILLSQSPRYSPSNLVEITWNHASPSL